MTDPGKCIQTWVGSSTWKAVMLAAKRRHQTIAMYVFEALTQRLDRENEDHLNEELSSHASR